MIKTWSKRKLTLIDRVTVIKSLMLSKFAYLFLALPNPPGDILRKLERVSFKFLWNKGPDRISRRQIVKNIETGGLRMIDIHAFITSLKVTWLKRIIMNSETDNWSILSGINFSRVTSLCDGYFKSISKTLFNPFWNDLIKSLQKNFFYSVLKIEEIEDILYSSRWCNTNFSEDGTFLILSWFEKGIKNVIDILDANGDIYNFEQLKETYILKGTFLGYQGLISKLPRAWLEAINEQKDKCIFLKYNIQMNCYIRQVMKDKKGSRKIYDKIEPVKEQLNKDRWNTELGHITNEEQNKVNSSLKYINEIKLRDFQFKINNKILVTNSFLHKINKIDNNLCANCQKETESIFHLLCTCDIVKEFWDTFKTWVSEKNKC